MPKKCSILTENSFDVGGVSDSCSFENTDELLITEDTYWSSFDGTTYFLPPQLKRLILIDVTRKLTILVLASNFLEAKS